MAEVKSQGAVDAMDVAEGARETEWEKPSFVGDLFLGKLNLDLIHPFPEQPAADRAEADDFLGRLERFLAENVDADKIDEQGEYDYSLFEGLNKLGAWGMKIPKEYGGLGFTATNYNRAIGLVATWCGSTVAWLSAHQSIGVPQPLKLFGTEEQKKKYLPRLAHGAISAFALTEPGVGSDPAKMETTAVKSPDGKGWIINGEKLWCTNGTKAELLVVMARTAPKIVNGKEKKQISAFIVETNTPGFLIEHRCQFMGLRGIRLLLRQPELFETQLSAILRAAAAGPVRVLLPMVTNVAEVRAARVIYHRVAERLRGQGQPMPKVLPPLGIMVETPGAALCAHALAGEAEFFAIGTNDLCMYALAVDRGETDVADLYDPLHPAMLRLIQMVAEGAAQARIPVSVCGEMAANPALTPLLIGLGLRSFSTNASAVPRVKQAVRGTTIDDCQRLTWQVMKQGDAARSRELIAKFGQ